MNTWWRGSTSIFRKKEKIQHTLLRFRVCLFVCLLACLRCWAAGAAARRGRSKPLYCRLLLWWRCVALALCCARVVLRAKPTQRIIRPPIPGSCGHAGACGKSSTHPTTSCLQREAQWWSWNLAPGSQSGPVVTVDWLPPLYCRMLAWETGFSSMDRNLLLQCGS